MNKYINIKTGEYPVSLIHIKNRKAKMSDYAIVVPTSKPSFDQFTEAPREIQPEEIKGKYYARYEVIQLNEGAQKNAKARYDLKNKTEARNEIRKIKDLEDDLVDQKQLLQFMARGFSGLWESLPDDIKSDNPYKDNFDAFSDIVNNTKFRLDLEEDAPEKIVKIITDEAKFADIVEEKYLSKK